MPATKNSLLQYLLINAENFPDQIAWWELPSEPTADSRDSLHIYSWKQIAERIIAVADRLSELGIHQTEHVASWFDNGREWWELDLALNAIGAVHVPLDRRLPVAAIRDRVVHCQSRYLLVAPETAHAYCQTLAQDAYQLITWPTESHSPGNIPREQNHIDRLVQIVRDLDEDKLACPSTILYTSGTSGQPRGVMLSQRGLVRNAIAKLDAAGQFRDDLRLNFLPFSHAYARTCEFSTWIISGSQLACATNIDHLFHWAKILQPTLINGVPYFFDRLRREALISGSESVNQHLGGRIRMLASGGAALPPELFDYYASQGLPVLQGYGLTEAGPVICSNRFGNEKGDTIGPAASEVELRVDASGELYVRGPSVMVGYWNDAQATSAAIRDGWLATGDFACQCADGHWKLLGRKNDIIVLSTGLKVWPLTIEPRLQMQSMVRHVVLVGDGLPFTIAIIDREPDQNIEITEREFQSQIAEILTDLPRESVPAFIIFASESWTQADGLLTSKGTPRRNAVAEKYKTEVAAIIELQRRGDR